MVIYFSIPDSALQMTWRFVLGWFALVLPKICISLWNFSILMAAKKLRLMSPIRLRQSGNAKVGLSTDLLLKSPLTLTVSPLINL